ncbi:hypothetical protein GPECTOR_87g431 [Gonium pectorale]|uniref:Protein kinase domain-containing protein n=1 Tax=Gonium pectorale TaxID=33097 RepID=A0A150G155_GONPE|nr:hypothetical protein GPECTOR_87g431 [Gonium pectorale]|eukprot:KXZ43568.1 hypothetical protein GPECTOR_87g431 [Gonium pectorale]
MVFVIYKIQEHRIAHTSEEPASNHLGPVAAWSEDAVVVRALPVSGDGSADASLLRELELLVRVCGNCRHVATLYGLTREDGRLALVMRRYPRSLAQELQAAGRMPPGRVLRLAQELLQALADLHAHGVVAGRLKPDNVLLDEEGRAWLADVGLPRAAAAAAAGDFAYMAPEQFSAAGQAVYLTPQTDMWALGATLLHALTGTPPWQGLGFGQVGLYGRSPNLPPDVPSELGAILQRCLDPVSRTRFYADHALYRVNQAITDAQGLVMASEPQAREPSQASGEQGSRLELAFVPDVATVVLPVHLVTGLQVSAVVAQSLLLVDTRQPKPLVRVVVHGVEDRPTGLELELEVDFTWTAEQFEDAVQRSWPQQQRLFLGDADGGARWTPWQPLLGAVGGSDPLHLHPVPLPDTQVYVKLSSGRTFTIDASLEWTVHDLMRAIYEEEGIPTDQQFLIHNRERLQAEWRLRDRGVEAWGTLFLALYLRGGKPVPCVSPAEPIAAAVRQQVCCH